MTDMKEMTPKKMVELFDQFVYGQQEAKAILAVAMRNRWRLCRLEKDARLGVVKQNILLSGPTGSGKTALLRVLKNSFGLPVLEIDITGYTETGYVGKEVSSIFKDLFSLTIDVPDWYKAEWNAREQRDVAAKAEPKEDLLKHHEENPDTSKEMQMMMSLATKILVACARIVLHGMQPVQDLKQRKEVLLHVWKMLSSQEEWDLHYPALYAARVKIHKTALNNIANQAPAKAMTIDLSQGRRILGSRDTDYSMFHGYDISEKLPQWDSIIAELQATARSMDVPGSEQLRQMGRFMSTDCSLFKLGMGSATGSYVHTDDPIEMQRLIRNSFERAGIAWNDRAAPDGDVAMWRKRFIEDYGVVFVDEIDKLAESNDSNGKDRVSRSGVQRSLLKVLEGEDGHESNTLNILWIAAGSFANQPISRLMPELQGRLPLRAVIKPLDRAAYVQILKLKNSVFNAAVSLLAVDGVTVLYDDATFGLIADACEIVNTGTANLGARRLGDVVNELMLPAMYEPDKFVEAGYDIRGDKAKWLLQNAEHTVKVYVDSVMEFREKK